MEVWRAVLIVEPDHLDSTVACLLRKWTDFQKETKDKSYL